MSQLPVELLPLIFSHLQKVSHLSSACQASSTFHYFAIPIFYERISIYSWHKQGKTRVIQLFVTLATCPHLAEHVLRLEIRDYPKGQVSTSSSVDAMNATVQGLMNCINLKSCTWTRDGSLKSHILRALQYCSNLRELEINGHDQGNYDPDLLLNFANLHRISLIMPSPTLITLILPKWLCLTGSSLRSLSIICKDSTAINDDFLSDIALNLKNLEHFSLTGCIRVSDRGVSSVISQNDKGLHSLGLERLSSGFDIRRFCSSAGAGSLSHLRSVTVTLDLASASKASNVRDLLSASHCLESFQIYSTATFYDDKATDELWESIIESHGQRLTRFSVHRILMSIQAVEKICRRCPLLRQFYVVIPQRLMHRLGSCLFAATQLRALHINFPLESELEDEVLSVLKPEEALKIVQHCSTTLTQFGCNTRVWQVNRRIVEAEGELVTQPYLSPYESPDIPEAFLVVRT